MSRRGSSLFAQGGAAPAGAPPASAKRQSVVLQPMAGGLGLDFDSDFSDSEDERSPPQPTPAPAAGNADRPMVGGFAAAAYEAAKAYHFQNKDKKKPSSSKRSGRP